LVLSAKDYVSKKGYQCRQVSKEASPEPLIANPTLGDTEVRLGQNVTTDCTRKRKQAYKITSVFHLLTSFEKIL
jgi:hypothetical protein